jgi:hypothetical protein
MINRFCQNGVERLTFLSGLNAHGFLVKRR